MNKKNPENLEFNDGLGDLLREKESRQFSLKRTLIVLVVFVTVVFVVLLFTVKVGTKFLFSPTDKVNAVKTEDIDSDALVRELAEMERLMAEKKAQESSLEIVATPSAQTSKADANASREVTRVAVPEEVPVKAKETIPSKVKETIPSKVKETIPPKLKDTSGKKVTTVPAAPVKAVPVVAAPVSKPAPVVPAPVKPVVAKPVSKPTPVAHVAAPVKPVKKSLGFPYKVIVGTFSDIQNATLLQEELKKQGIDAFVWDRDTDGKRWHAVQAAAFPDQASAQRFVATLRKKGYPAYVLRK